jgi:hypothetical protein
MVTEDRLKEGKGTLLVQIKLIPCATPLPGITPRSHPRDTARDPTAARYIHRLPEQYR